MPENDDPRSPSPQTPDQEHNPTPNGSLSNPAFTLQERLAAARAEALKLQQDEQRQREQALEGLDPLVRLERAVWMMQHEQVPGPFGAVPPLSEAGIARIQHEALQAIHETLRALQDPFGRIEYVRSVLLNLKLLQDYDLIIGAVLVRAEHFIDHLSEDLEHQVLALRKQAKKARNELKKAETTLQMGRENVGSTTYWLHLVRAAAILARYPDLKTKEEFYDKAGLLQDELGPKAKNAGESIWRGVKRLGEQLLGTTSLPKRYHNFAGFRLQISELLHEDFIIQDNRGTRIG